MVNKELIQQIGQRLIDARLTIAVAESVTSGHIQAALSLATDARLFFQGGITVYNLGQKARHLNVEPIHAEDINCVSDKVSKEMALNVCQLFTSDYGLGITGYASTVPEKGINELFAHISIAKSGHLLLNQKIVAKEGDPLQAQLSFTEQSLQLLLQVLGAS